MNRVTSPLAPDMRGASVADLHEALRALIERGVLGDEQAADLVRALEEESHDQFYGAMTGRIVAMFQERRRLEMSGHVDERTADAINNYLQEFGLLDRTANGRARTIVGRVRREDDLPMPGVAVRAYAALGEQRIHLAATSTDCEGRFTIRYDTSFNGHAVRVACEAEDGRVLSESGPIDGSRELDVIDLVVPLVMPGVDERRIEGWVRFENGLPARELTLLLYRSTFGAETTLIAEVLTLADGYYAISYTHDSTGLEIRARDERGQETALTTPMFHLGGTPRSRVDLVAPSSLQRVASEFQRLSEAVVPHVGDAMGLTTAVEGDERQDLSFLSRSTGWDARTVALAASAARLKEESDIPLSQEMLYGLFRAGMPTDKAHLAKRDGETIGLALTKARDSGVIDLSDGQIAEARHAFEEFATQARLTVAAPRSSATYEELLRASGISDEDQQLFARTFLRGRSTASDLWNDARAAGVSVPAIEALRSQGKFAFLTQNNATLTARLHEDPAISSPADLVTGGFYDKTKWTSEITALANATGSELGALVPSAYSGDTPEIRLQAYAEDMARKVRVSYPSQVLAHVIDDDADDAFDLGEQRSPVVGFLKTAAQAGFRLGETPVQRFVEDHEAIFAASEIGDVKQVTETVKTLQRVYQITPSNGSMPVLIGLGLKSAYDVVALSKDEFIGRYADRFPSPIEAELVYRKAEQVTSITYNVFAIAKRLEDDSGVHVISTPPAAKHMAKQKLIKQFPTMSSLFGSTDFCECDHCRSVLSPAAYLVDLLQFIDPEPTEWGNFVAHWDDQHKPKKYLDTFNKPYESLITRRPDLPHVPLTCENTKTVLPYIDIVNEILEYYVANEELDEQAAHDTGSLTTEDLLAEPQNVLFEAYARLEKARYPLGLPFDLWVETVRRFCAYFGTPLPDLLDTFRTTDALRSASDPYDREDVFAESLGIATREWAIFTDPSLLTYWFELYGYPSESDALTPATDAMTDQRIDLNSAKALARRLEVSYRELVRIVQTGFVNPKVTELTMLDKLGVSVADAALAMSKKAWYEANKDLFGEDRATLSAADRARFDALESVEWEMLGEIDTFHKKVAELTPLYEPYEIDAAGWLAQEAGIADALVLADPDTGCDFDKTILRYAAPRSGESEPRPADAIAFLRINLFVRLWRHLGWPIEEVDAALMAFIPKNTPFTPAHVGESPLATALIYIAHLKSLTELVQTGSKGRLKLLSLWTDLDRVGTDSLYADLFLRPGVLKIDPIFDHALGDYLSTAAIAKAAATRRFTTSAAVKLADKIDPPSFGSNPKIEVTYDDVFEVQTLTYTGQLDDSTKQSLSAMSPSPALPQLLDAVQAEAGRFTRVSGHLVALQGALGVTDEVITEILADIGTTPDEALLSIDTASLIYRYAMLAKGLRLSVSELIALKDLAKLDPFTPLSADPITTLADDHPFSQTLRFVEIAHHVRESGLDIDELSRLFRHPKVGTELNQTDTNAAFVTIKTLGDGIAAIRSAHSMPDDPAAATPELLRQELMVILEPDVVERLLAMIDGSVAVTVTRESVEEGERLDPSGFIDEPRITVAYDGLRKLQSLTVVGVLFDDDVASLKSRLPTPTTPPHISSVLFNELLDEAQAATLAFFVDNLLVQTIKSAGDAGFFNNADFNELFKPLMPPVTIEQDDTDDQIKEKQAQNAIIQQANEAELNNRRFSVLGRVIPVVNRHLTRSFVTETLTAAMPNSEPSLVEGLLTDVQLLREPRTDDPATPVLDGLVATADRGVSVTFFTSDDGSGPAAATAVFADADTAWHAPNEGSVRTPAMNSVAFEGHLEVPASGPYRFSAQLEKAGATIEMRFDDIQDAPLVRGTASEPRTTLSEYIELTAGALYRFTIEMSHLDGGDARVGVQGKSLANGPLGRLTLRPRAPLERAERALIAITKALRLLGSQGLTLRETTYLLTHAADFSDLSLRLPTRADDPAAATSTDLFAQFLRLASYGRLKRELAAGEALIDIFEAPTRDGAMTALAQLAKRDIATVTAIANVLSLTDFRNDLDVRRAWTALQVVACFGVSVTDVWKWGHVISRHSSSGKRFAIARSMKEAIRARLDEDAWRTVAQPIFDELRRLQRDALTAYTMGLLKVDRVEQLYEYFLIDPGMEPVVQTSRIRLAIASVQLFIQRCLLNLEADVHPSAINAKQWGWMKRYRVWEANRKIFLFPENWLEPEFRDDKTHLYKELEGVLLESDVSNDVVEGAFLAYLRKFEGIARLDIAAMHLEDNADPALRVLHVIGRTFKQPHEYFYRRCAHQMWTPWEPIPVEIAGDHLAPVIWRDRLFLFWVTFLEKPAPSTSTGSGLGSALKVEVVGAYAAASAPPFVATAIDTPKKKNNKLTEVSAEDLADGLKSANSDRLIEAQLHWCEYINGEWSSRESGGFAPTITKIVAHPFDPKSVFVHVSKEPFDDGAERGVYVHLGGTISKSFYLAGRNATPELSSHHESSPGMPYSKNGVDATRYKGKGALTVEFKGRIETESGKSPTNTIETPAIFSGGGSFTVVPCDNTILLGAPDASGVDTSNPTAVLKAIKAGLTEIATLMEPIFYQDNAHTLFIEPNVTERTLEEWEEWIERPPKGDPFDHELIQIKPQYPKPDLYFVDPLEEIWNPPHEAMFTVINDHDWIANPTTGLIFDGVLVGPYGRVEADVAPSVLAGKIATTGRAAIDIHGGSDVEHGSAVVVRNEEALSRAGLAPLTSGLNVVGTTGFNAALAQTIDSLNARTQG